MHHDGFGLCVGQQVPQLFGHVSVVDVERGNASLERAQHAFQVLVAVVQIDGHV